MKPSIFVPLLVASCSLAGEPGIVVSVSPPATRVGEKILAHGGNAVDAAVAVGFALTVTWPEAGNIGGGGFMLVRPAGAKSEPVVFEYRETAPARATADLFVVHGKKPHLTVGVPGSVAGMAKAHEKFGKLPWKDLVEPAVNLAEEGFAIDRALAGSLNSGLAKGAGTPEFRRVFGKEKWQAGDRLVQKDLAKTLRRIGEQGPNGFYRGETAALLEKEMATNGGLITRADLASYQARERRPLRGTYRGHDIFVPPSPSAGGTCLLTMLQILEPFDLKKEGPTAPRTLHLMIEAMRRAYCDRARYQGDADFVKVPAHLTSKEHARKLAESIDLEKATRSDTLAADIPLTDEKPSTTHYSILDGSGMAVSTTTTLEASFGAKIVVPGAGFLLNNEMTDFNPLPGVTTRGGIIGTPPNTIQPGKRMISSMTPTLVVREGKPVLITGSPGGRTIPNTVLCVVLDVLEFGLSVNDAVAAPRIHHQWFPDRVQVEPGLFEKHRDVMATLTRMGHRVERVRAQGDAHSIGLDPKSGKYVGATDPRRAGRPAAFR